MRANSWLETEFGNEFFSGNFNHLKLIIDRLNLRPKSSQIITIAGTNGKGQVSRTVSKLLALNSCNTMMLTSPHLVSVTERISINNDHIADKDLENIFCILKERLENDFKKVSYFEFIFLCFLYKATIEKPEFIILEVGLGGRLDATNVIDANIACIVSISRDHQELLGNRFDLILYEKLGIRRKNQTLVSCFELDYLYRKTKTIIQNEKINYYDLVREKTVEARENFVQKNGKLALKIVELALGKTDFLKLKNINLAKRQSLVINNNIFDFYPSHNVDGIRKLVQYLNVEEYNDYKFALISFSKREWKDLCAMCRVLTTVFKNDSIRLVRFNHMKSIGNKDLEKLKVEFKFEIVNEEEIFNSINYESSKVLITGSNYFIGSLFSKLSSKK